MAKEKKQFSKKQKIVIIAIVAVIAVAALLGGLSPVYMLGKIEADLK